MREFKVFGIFSLFFLVVFSGCDKDNNGPTGPADSGLSAETYLPLKVGTTWTYEATGTEQGEAFTDTTIITIVETITKNNKIYFVISDSDEGLSYGRIENNIFYYFEPDESEEEVPIELPRFNFNKEAGQTWDIIDHSESNEGYSETWTLSGKFHGTENITVPKGTFTNCAKFEIIINYIKSDINNVELESVEGTQFFWFAPNVGFVKFTDELKKDKVVLGTSTEELINYYIPQ